MTENFSSPSQKGRIFISYRRIDTSYAAGRIYDHLVEHFGADAIFMDVDVIEGGVDFVKVLEDAVQSCDVLIALIGGQWLSVKDMGGNRRLDNPEDFVRIEIATALKRNIRVIPVLVDGVDMPQSNELPENLKALSRRNALQVNHHSFNPDVYRLIEHSESALNEAEVSRVMKAQALQTAREKAAKEKAEREAAEKAAREKTEREAAEKSEESKSKSVKEENQILEVRLPEFEDMPPLPDKFPDGWDTEWQPSFESEAAKIDEKSEVAEKTEPENQKRDIDRGLKKIDKDHKRRLQKIEWRYRWETFVNDIRYRLKLLRINFKLVLIVLIGLAVIIPLLVDLSNKIPELAQSLNVTSTATNTSVAQLLTSSKTIEPSRSYTKTLTPSLTPTQSFTPAATSSPTKTTQPIDSDMVLVPAGTFTMGSNDVIGAKPAHQVFLDAFWIDKTEVTNEMYSRCVEAAQCDPPASLSSETRSNYFGNPEFDNYPVIRVNWYMAKDYCEWIGGRLPTEAEWEKAARGTDGRPLPWGYDATNPKLLNFYYSYIGDTSEVGIYPRGASVYGVLDMAGNVYEWVSSLKVPYPYDENDGREDLNSSDERVLKGGSFQHIGNWLRSDNRISHPSSSNGVWEGFRCAKDASP